MEPHIYDSYSFAGFLSDYLEWKRSQRRTFSIAVLANKIGTISRPYLSMVITGKRHPPADIVRKICSALELSEQETAYAIAMVARDKSKDHVEVAAFNHYMTKLKHHSHSEEARV